LLGEGGVGEVWLAHDRGLGRDDALKVLRRVPEAALASLIDEARAMARVRHPNVVALLDAGTHAGEVFIALEYVDGANLRRHMRAHALAATDASGVVRAGPVLARAEALRILADVARGLAAAHAVDVLHLDVKPENVLIGADGRARVGDFGLARVRAGDACIELDGPPSGTPAYMAPELWLGEGVCDGTDVWSFAIVACELLTGTRPFDAPTREERMALVLGARDLGAPDALGVAGAPAPLAQLVRASLIRDRHARPTMRDFERALDAEVSVERAV
jgi:serine/threonine-protein kinase